MNRNQAYLFSLSFISIVFIIFFASIAVCIIFTVNIYNTIQINEESVISSWATVESAYQRRSDLVPNLVEIVKASAIHEKETLTSVIEARSKITSIKAGNQPIDINRFQSSQNELGAALSRLMIVIEGYPELKANQNYRDLLAQLEGTENRINVARVRYNEAVKIFNTSIRTFPNNLINKYTNNLEKKESFKADEDAGKAPKIKFN